jgi:Family of unknown function (DUF6221)
VNDDLIHFLTARLDEDEMRAAGAPKGPWTWIAMRGYPQRITNPEAAVVAHTYTEPDAPAYIAEHIVRHDPARTLLEVAAKRRIIAMHRENAIGDCRRCGEGPCETLRALALPYADCPGYLPTWRL